MVLDPYDQRPMVFPLQLPRNHERESAGRVTPAAFTGAPHEFSKSVRYRPVVLVAAESRVGAAWPVDGSALDTFSQ